MGSPRSQLDDRPRDREGQQNIRYASGIDHSTLDHARPARYVCPDQGACIRARALERRPARHPRQFASLARRVSRKKLAAALISNQSEVDECLEGK